MPHCNMGETSGAVYSVNSHLTRSTPEALEDSFDSGRLSLRLHIVQLYGEDVYKKTRLYKILRIKHSKNLARLAFLKRCRDNNIIPSCMKLKHHKKEGSRSVNRILQKAELSILRIEIANTRHELHKINTQMLELSDFLKNKLQQSDWEDLNGLTSQEAEKILRFTTEGHIKKFNKLLTQYTSTQKVTLDPHKVIVNLTNEEIDGPTTSLLLKGLNYAIAPKKIPTEEIICSVECAVKDLPDPQAEEIRQDVAVVLRRAKPPTSNLTRQEKAALRALREDDAKLIIPADKGNATVIMKTDQYKNKMNELLASGPYKEVKNPTRRINAEVSTFVKYLSDCDGTLKKKLINTDPTPPLLYGLPKVHKEDIPMRPIVSSIGSPTYNVAKFLSQQLSRHVGTTDSFVKDSRHFIKLIKDIRLNPEDILVSFDVESLFTQVPIAETVKLIEELLSQELAELAELCLRSTYFYFDGKFYEQTNGAAMGSPLSPVAANIYMESFEKTALETAALKPRTWLRYVDDVWAIWPHGRDTLESFLEHLNAIHDNIKFTMEIEKDCKLPFLDVLTTRNPSGVIGHSVYRKPTHTNRYLNADSHHHPAQKSGILNTLINRAIHISDTVSLKKEEKLLRDSLKQNGYTACEINSAFKKQAAKCSQQIENEENGSPADRQERPKCAYLPYVKGTTEKIERILRRNEIKTVFKPVNKIKDFLRPVKDKIPLNTPGVYEIPCSCGAVYIGETKRLISTRLKEHIRYTKNEDVDKSALAEHSSRTKHGIKFDETKVLAKIPFYYPRIVRESLEIAKNENNLNREDGYRIPRAWQPVITALKSNGRTSQ